MTADRTDHRSARRDRLYRRWVARTGPIMDVLAFIFLGDFLATRLFPDGPAWWQPSLTAVSLAIWFAFAVDYVVRASLSPRPWQFIRTHKLDLLMVLLPMLRLLRVILVLRRSFQTISTERIASSLISIVMGIVVAGAFVEWRIEYNAPGANITTFGTALWWSIVTTTTVGYGDTFPVTVAGRVVGSAIMVVGIGLIGTVSATVAAWFVNHKRRLAAGADGAAPAPPPATDHDLTSDPAGAVAALAALAARIEALSAQQADLRAMIERLADQRRA